MNSSKSTVPNDNEFDSTIVINQVIKKSTTAFQHWSSLSHKQRKKYLLKWQYAITQRLEDIAEMIHRENGKPYTDALLEVFAALYHSSYSIKRAPKTLKSKRVSSGWFCNYKATLHYQPMGIIGIIGPWNMPFSIPINQITSALAAGNTVVLKPSEITPLVGQLIAQTAQNIFPIENVIQVINGNHQTGKALIRSGVNKIAITGSFETGQHVMKAASDNIIPLLMELSGKDALLIGSDAKLSIAARRAVWGAFVLSGQACISIERCYVVADVYQQFINNLIIEAQKIVLGKNGAIPDIVKSEQVEIIRAQVQDALDKGAQLVYGNLNDIQGNYVPPLILTHTTHKMKIMQEETFGPVIAILQVKDLNEAVCLANQSPYALGASVFGRVGVSSAVQRLRAGMVSVNSVWATTLIPSLPFGGYGKSGFGRVHGDAGLLEFSNIKAVAEEKISLPFDLMSFGIGKFISTEKLITAIRWLYGKNPISQFFNNVKLL